MMEILHTVQEWQWAQPWWLIALVVPPILLGWEYLTRNSTRSIPLPGIGEFSSRKGTRRLVLRAALPWIRALCLTMVILALARPRTAKGEESVKTDAIDIMMSVDVSSSMNAMDFTPNRLAAAKSTAAAFIDSRPNDRIGLVVFSAQAFTQCPLTNDHNVLKLLLQGVTQGWVENGTAIGMGLAQSVLRLKDSETLSKIVILLTDGVNNRFEVNPLDAMQLAQQYDIKVYTIGMGTNGYADVPRSDFAGNTKIVRELVEIDEELLTQIAEETGGQYFRATDLEDLESVYQEIDRLEKTTLEVTRYVRYQEWYWPFAILAALLLLLELIIRYTVARMLPD